MTEIYGLFSTRDCRIRYVGKTDLGVSERHWQHVQAASKGLGQSCSRWIQDSFFEGYDIRALLLDRCPDNEWSVREAHWVRQFADLKNRRLNKVSALATTAAGRKANMEASKRARRLISNYSGYTGITHHLHNDCYTVSLCYRAQGRLHFLPVPGDTRPGSQIDDRCWFSDPKRAIEARDAEKYRVNTDRIRVSTNFKSPLPAIEWPKDKRAAD